MFNKLKLNFPNASTSAMAKIIYFHDKCIILLIFVLSVVFILLIFNFFSKKRRILNLDKTFFEILWTIVPTILIILIMIPSLELLYFSEEIGGVEIKKNVKIVGHQWYWTYEINKEKKIINFDSYMIPEETLSFGEFRKCEVDRPLFLKLKETSRVLVTSADSIHSWSVPEFGIKVDAIPGRLNQIFIFPEKVGRFFGFCSELCGINHRFMPIVVEVIKI
jgi:heme/copper-type cytochrome/quinol oxidase subunit 2